jgi:hypothetical protein
MFTREMFDMVVSEVLFEDRWDEVVEVVQKTSSSSESRKKLYSLPEAESTVVGSEGIRERESATVLSYPDNSQHLLFVHRICSCAPLNVFESNATGRADSQVLPKDRIAPLPLSLSSVVTKIL